MNSVIIALAFGAFGMLFAVLNQLKTPKLESAATHILLFAILSMLNAIAVFLAKP